MQIQYLNRLALANVGLSGVDEYFLNGWCIFLAGRGEPGSNEPVFKPVMLIVCWVDSRPLSPNFGCGSQSLRLWIDDNIIIGFSEKKLCVNKRTKENRRENFQDSKREGNKYCNEKK
jgi:hypothetical protein